jgi:hypothetical protein
MWCAIEGAKSYIGMDRATYAHAAKERGQTPELFSPYHFSPNGSGFQAFARLEKIMDSVPNGDRYRESMFKCFFRYAYGLFFPETTEGWWACTGCDSLWGRGKKSGIEDDKTCMGCGSALRPFTWADLAEIKKTKRKK